MKKVNLLTVLMPVILLFLFSCKQNEKKDTDKPKDKAVSDQEEATVPFSTFKTVFVIGDVTVTHADGSGKKLASGESLTNEDTVTTGTGAAADLQYRDRGVIRLSENSKCTLKTVSDTLSDSTELNLKKGKVSVSLGKLKKEQFSVTTQTIVAAVRGTSFVVTADSRKTVISVAKGTVTVAPKIETAGIKESTDISAIETDVTAGEKAVILQEDIPQYTEGTKQVAAVPMTNEDLVQSKEDISAIRIEEAPDVIPEVKTEIRKEVPEQIDKAEEILRRKEENRAEEERAAAAAIAENRRRREQARKKELEQKAARQEAAEEQEKDASVGLVPAISEEEQHSPAASEETSDSSEIADTDNFNNTDIRDQNDNSEEATDVALNQAPPDEPYEARQNFDEIEFDSDNADEHEDVLSDTSVEQKRKGAPKTEITGRRKTRIKPVDFSAKYGISVRFWGELGSMDAEDWIEYVIIVPEEGDYNIMCSMTSFEKKGKIELIAGESKTEITVPSTISGDIGGVLPVDRGGRIHLKKGEQTIRIHISEGGAFTINYMSIKKEGPLSFGDLLDLFR